MITWRWIISHRCSWMAVYVLCCNAQSSLKGVKMISICMYCFLGVCQLPRCNLFTQHVIYLRRATSSELWIPVLLFTYNLQLFTALCLLSANYYFFPFDTFNPLFSAKLVILTTSSQVGGRVTWLCCAGLHVATSIGSAPCQSSASNTFGVFPCSYWFD